MPSSVPPEDEVPVPSSVPPGDADVEPVPDAERARLLALAPEALSLEQLITVYGDQVERAAKYHGVGLYEAASGLRMQEPAGRLAELGRSLTSDFGGLWMDWQAEGGPAVVLALTSERRDALGTQSLDEFVAESGLPVRYATVRFPVAELEGVASEVTSELDRTAKAGSFVVWADEPNNVVRVSGVDPGFTEVETATGRVSVIAEQVDRPFADAIGIEGGWDGGNCTMAFPIVSPDNRYAIPTAGHCGSVTTPTYPSSPPVTLGARTQIYDANAPGLPGGDPEIDRQIHVVPVGHTGVNRLREPGVTITRGLATRLVIGATVFYYGQRSVNDCGRLPAQPVTVTGIGTLGQILARSSVAMAGGGNTWIEGDSGGPVWALNTAVAMITAAPFGADCTTFSTNNTGFAISTDRQFTDVPGAPNTFKFMLQEGTGTGNFAAMGTWHARDPSRILDTRNSVAIAAGSAIDVAIPSAPVDLAGVTVNVTVIPVSGDGFVSIYPVTSGPGTTFFVPTDAQMVRYATWIAGSSGTVRVVNGNQLRVHVTGTGSAHVIIDYTGWYSRATGDVAIGNGRVYSISSPSGPVRVYDSRTTSNPLGPGAVRAVQVRNIGGVPAGAYAVAVNVIGITPTAPTHLTVYRNGIATPGMSNINIVPGEIIARMVPVQVGTSDSIAVFNLAGSTDFVVDVVGWWVNANATLNDGRAQLSGQFTIASFSLAPGESREVDSTPPNATVGPKWGTRAALLNIRLGSATAPGHIVVHQLSPAPAGVSNMNYTSSNGVSNGVVARTEADGTFWITNCACGVNTVSVSISVTGWLLG